MERQLSAVLVQLTSSSDALAASESVLSPLEENPSYAVSLVQTLETHADAKVRMISARLPCIGLNSVN